MVKAKRRSRRGGAADEGMFDATSGGSGATPGTSKSQRRRAKKQARALELESAIQEATAEKPNPLLGDTSLMDDNGDEWSYSTTSSTMDQDGWLSGSSPFAGGSGEAATTTSTTSASSALALAPTSPSVSATKLPSILGISGQSSGVQKLTTARTSKKSARRRKEKSIEKALVVMERTVCKTAKREQQRQKRKIRRAKGY
mmetsp:Transcript_7475/g.23026  ORF Transcript_7475/g.23026 Transcript_7475/m.23026 type:complete len:200 (+) Transcript_7475:26-625(+)|eukprot:CAMPEP_0177665182 /NCGR_PEP_ID=MMETSP0447-20121125/20910_1 /TAXON_ID=0 /ORGANISM="Stygamoeba regulata, Strain BSH-02190019" /LENGTH=199 /DNA_ID=CAMNT_0019171243 /DNA_START=18 /DNA_END=617 /DNA_ORIENTATION=-